MKDAVVIKSFPNGITLLLKEDATFDEILQEVAFKFTEAKNFFGSANMALSIEGKSLADSEELQIVEVIRQSSNLNIICLVEHDEEKDQNYIKALQEVDKDNKPESNSDGQFFKGNLKNKEVLESESSIVILGDVHPGSSVISGSSIIVLGSLYGSAYAGENGRPGAYVVALEMTPEKIKIGDFKYKDSITKHKLGLRPKIQPKVAYVKNGRVVFDLLTKELLDSI